jgi:ComF family protein
LNFPVDVIVPVPLGRERMRERGYNQVAMVAYPLAMLGGWDYQPACLYRSRETASQVGLTIAQRRQNVQDAFEADPGLIDGRDVLLIDDVATTGATISSCSRALLQAGARAVHALTIARALPHHGLNIV